jgi:hypothetical protein
MNAGYGKNWRRFQSLIQEPDQFHHEADFAPYMPKNYQNTGGYVGQGHEGHKDLDLVVTDLASSDY